MNLSKSKEQLAKTEASIPNGSTQTNLTKTPWDSSNSVKDKEHIDRQKNSAIYDLIVS